MVVREMGGGGAEGWKNTGENTFSNGAHLFNATFIDILITQIFNLTIFMVMILFGLVRCWMQW